VAVRVGFTGRADLAWETGASAICVGLGRVERVVAAVRWDGPAGAGQAIEVAWAVRVILAGIADDPIAAGRGAARADIVDLVTVGRRVAVVPGRAVPTDGVGAVEVSWAVSIGVTAVTFDPIPAGRRAARTDLLDLVAVRRGLAAIVCVG
jgi:hypothetical protein